MHGVAWPNLRRGAVHDPALGFPVWEGRWVLRSNLLERSHPAWGLAEYS